uniref:Uncharacterized protein n=1 Tax=Cucumis sativus TaxID=3659 RepID=A0A0A0KY07_CUCSA
MSGLRINGSECCVLGINSEEEKIKRWADWIGCGVGSLPSSYLGLVSLFRILWWIKFTEGEVCKCSERLMCDFRWEGVGEGTKALVI